MVIHPGSVTNLCHCATSKVEIKRALWPLNNSIRLDKVMHEWTKNAIRALSYERTTPQHLRTVSLRYFRILWKPNPTFEPIHSHYQVEPHLSRHYALDYLYSNKRPSATVICVWRNHASTQISGPYLHLPLRFCDFHIAGISTSYSGTRYCPNFPGTQRPIFGRMQPTVCAP